MSDIKTYEVVKIRNIGEMIIDMLLTETKSGKRQTNGQIVDAVRAVFTNAKTTKACVAWYVTALKDESFRAKHNVSEERFELYRSLKADKS